MDLNVTVGQLLKNSQARQILAREFPNLVNSPLLQFYANTPVKRVLSMVKGKVNDDKIQRIINELEQV